MWRSLTWKDWVANSFDPLPQQQEEGQIVKSGLPPGPFPHGKSWSTPQKAAHQEQPSQHNPTGNRPCCHVLCLIFLYQHYLAEQQWAYRCAWSTTASEALPPLLSQNLQGILMTHETDKQTNKPLASFVISFSLCWKPSQSLSRLPPAVGTLVQCFDVVLGCPLLFLPHSVAWPCREVSTASCCFFVPVPGNLMEFSFAVQNLPELRGGRCWHLCLTLHFMLCPRHRLGFWPMYRQKCPKFICLPCFAEVLSKKLKAFTPQQLISNASDCTGGLAARRHRHPADSLSCCSGSLVHLGTASPYNPGLEILKAGNLPTRRRNRDTHPWQAHTDSYTDSTGSCGAAAHPHPLQGQWKQTLQSSK